MPGPETVARTGEPQGFPGLSTAEPVLAGEVEAVVGAGCGESWRSEALARS